MAVFVPKYEHGYLLSASAASDVAFLEIQWAMDAGDAPDLATCDARLPFFSLYSAARTYKEPIKSPKTTSRTLVPEHTVPRFAMGSVQARVGVVCHAHAHALSHGLV
jgi:hypothetical protein